MMGDYSKKHKRYKKIDFLGEGQVKLLFDSVLFCMRLHTCSGGSGGVVSLKIAVVVGDDEALLVYY